MADKPWLKKTDEKVIEVMGAKVTLKPMTWGESRKAVSQSMKVDVKTGEPDVDASLIGVLRALAQIKDWELTDENDKKLPVTLDTLDNELNEEFVSELISEINEQDDNHMNDDEKKD